LPDKKERASRKLLLLANYPIFHPGSLFIHLIINPVVKEYNGLPA
jgi:hypothetical protein